MADFKVTVTTVDNIEKHPKADRLSVCQVKNMGYRVVCGLDQFKVGEKVAYIPENAVIPDELLDEMGLTGRLAGKQKNRVKAAKIRSILSEGLVYSLEKYTHLLEGVDVADFLGITKYTPEIPVSMDGEVEEATDLTVKYDIENIKKYPDVLIDDEQVVVTEKLHGTLLHLGYHKEHGFVIASKGIAQKGLRFIINDKNKISNVYVRESFETGAANRLKNYVDEGTVNDAVFMCLLCEIVGKGIQDLNYGLKNKQIHLFDIYYRRPDGSSGYVDFDSCRRLSKLFELKMVPLLQRAAGYSEELVQKHLNGDERVSNEAVHVREGIVIKPMVERRDDMLGRVILKAVSDEYLVRKGGTERN